MGIITISRDSFSHGEKIADKLAAELGYATISREVVLAASQHFNIPELQLQRSIHDAPSVLERFKYGKEHYIAYIRRELLGHFRKDNLVYHGLAGHFFVRTVPGILKVRITADLDVRMEEELRREKIPESEVLYRLKKDDEERRKWSQALYGIDTWDSRLYDAVLHLGQMSVDDVVAFLVELAHKPCFQSTPETQSRLDDLYRAASIECKLVEEFPRVRADCSEGNVHVSVVGPLEQRKHIESKIRQLAADIEGIKEIHVNIIPTIPLGLSF